MALHQVMFLAQVVPAAVGQARAFGLPLRSFVAALALGSQWGKAAAHFNYLQLEGRGDAGVQVWSSNDPTGHTVGGGYALSQQYMAKFSCPASGVRAAAAALGAGVQAWPTGVAEAASFAQLLQAATEFTQTDFSKVDLEEWNLVPSDLQATFAVLPALKVGP